MINNYIILKKALNTLILVFFSGYIMGQINLGLPSVSGKAAPTTFLLDYEAIGVNPANLGYDENRLISISFAKLDFTAQSKALDVHSLIKSFTHYKEQFTDADKSKYSRLFTTDDGFNMNAYMDWLSLSINLGKYGGVAVNLRDRMNVHLGCNDKFADILFNGSKSVYLNSNSIKTLKVSEYFSGSSMKFYHFRELNLAYGNRIYRKQDKFDIYAGIGFRYIWGLSFVDMYADDKNLSGTSAFNAANYTWNADTLQTFKLSNAGSLFNSSGHGTAFDFGANLLLKNKFKFSISVLNIGTLNWKKNTMKAINVNIKKLDDIKTGFNSWDIPGQAGYLFDNTGLLRYQDIKKDTTLTLPSKFRIGVGIKVNNYVELGADMYSAINEINGYKDKTFYSIGAALSLYDFIKLNTGITANANVGLNIPLGITLSAKNIYEIYIATNDILSYFISKPNSMVSFSVCVIRINLPVKVFR